MVMALSCICVLRCSVQPLSCCKGCYGHDYNHADNGLLFIFILMLASVHICLGDAHALAHEYSLTSCPNSSALPAYSFVAGCRCSKRCWSTSMHHCIWSPSCSTWKGRRQTAATSCLLRCAAGLSGNTCHVSQIPPCDLSTGVKETLGSGPTD